MKAILIILLFTATAFPCAPSHISGWTMPGTQITLVAVPEWKPVKTVVGNPFGYWDMGRVTGCREYIAFPASKWWSYEAQRFIAETDLWLEFHPIRLSKPLSE